MQLILAFFAQAAALQQVGLGDKKVSDTALISGSEHRDIWDGGSVQISLLNLIVD